MTMSVIWTAMAVLSVLCGLATGRGEQVAAAAVEGAGSAVELCLGIAGMLCLWMGVMEVMRRSGLADGLSRLLSPVLRLLFPKAARDRETMDCICANVSANLLGLGNAATPLGIQAAQRMGRSSPGRRARRRRGRADFCCFRNHGRPGRRVSASGARLPGHGRRSA